MAGAATWGSWKVPPSSLYRTKIKHLIPGNRGGADLAYSGVGEDGMSWVVKLRSPQPYLPITEWLGYHIYEACGLPVPYYGVLELPNGDTAFGSRVEGGLEQIAGRSAADLIPDLSSCTETICGVLALDLWYGNEDRHFSNFLWRRNDLGQAAPMAIDFSRAFLVRGWPAQDLRRVPCNTNTLVTFMRQAGLWRTDVASLALARAASITAPVCRAWLDDSPPDWLDIKDKDTLTGWWSSQPFHERIQNCTVYCS